MGRFNLKGQILTPTQALHLLDNIVSQMQLSRIDHANAGQAVQVLNAAINPAPEAPEPLKEPIPKPTKKD
jgi:protein subunit release factor A